MSKSKQNLNVDEEILKTHAESSDGKELDVGPLLQAVKEIFNPPFDYPANYSEKDSAETEKAIYVFGYLSDKINEIGDEISEKCREEGHKITISILKRLPNYSWGSKLAIALAGFAMNYAEFWIVQHGCLESDSELAKSIACLKQLSIDDLNKSKDRLTAMKEVIELCLHIADEIVKLGKRQAKEHHDTDIKNEIQKAKIHFTVYSAIKSILVCASQIKSLEMGEIVPSTKDALELGTGYWKPKLDEMLEGLKLTEMNCVNIIAGKKLTDYRRQLKELFGKENNDNTDSLKALICTKNDEKPLINKTNEKTDIDVVKGKNVLLLISELNILEQEITVLCEKYDKLQSDEKGNEIVWLPIIDNWDEKESRDKVLRAKMPWYSVVYSSLKDIKEMIEFIKKEWSFNKKPMLVVINSKGKLVCNNAFHMLWIWGNKASPFNSEKERELWNEESWNLKLLMNDIDPTVSQWIQDKKYICLYGGVDKDWIPKFTEKAKEVAVAAGIDLEMVYVGKSNPKGKVDENILNIVDKNLSHRIQNTNSIWFFWDRIASMCYSKLQLGKPAGNDPIMKGVMSMLSLDSEPKWAVLGNEKDLIVEAKGDIFLTSLEEYDKWKEKAESGSFMSALTKELNSRKKNHHCIQLTLPSEEGKLGDEIHCAECGKTMDRVTLYKCCDEP